MFVTSSHQEREEKEKEEIEGPLSFLDLSMHRTHSLVDATQVSRRFLGFLGQLGH